MLLFIHIKPTMTSMCCILWIWTLTNMNIVIWVEFDFRWIWPWKVDPHQLSLPDWPVQCWLPGSLPQDTENCQGRPLHRPSYYFTTVQAISIPLFMLLVYYCPGHQATSIPLGLPLHHCPNYQYTSVQATGIPLGLLVYHCQSYKYTTVQATSIPLSKLLVYHLDLY